MVFIVTYSAYQDLKEARKKKINSVRMWGLNGL